MSINAVIKKIKANEEYNLTNIKDEGLFPWTKNLQTIRKIVKKDYWGENMLKAEVGGEKQGMEYRIKGKHIIQFIKVYGPGFMMAGSNKAKYGNNTRGSGGES